MDNKGMELTLSNEERLLPKPNSSNDNNNRNRKNNNSNYQHYNDDNNHLQPDLSKIQHQCNALEHMHKMYTATNRSNVVTLAELAARSPHYRKVVGSNPAGSKKNLI